MRGPISYYGGKAMLAGRILQRIPVHTTYVEPFFGGGAVFWAKEKSQVEVINDVNGELINFFQQIQNNCAELKREILGTPHSRRLHKDAWVIYTHPHLFSPLRRAWAVWTLANMGFSSQLAASFGTSVTTDAQPKKIANKRAGFGEHFAQRLCTTTIECRDAIKVIEQYDSADTFHYVDPPYYNSDCGSYSGYSEEDYTRLLNTLAHVKGKFLLSSYPSDILDRFIQEHGWKHEQIHGSVSVSRSKKRRKGKIECFSWNW